MQPDGRTVPITTWDGGEKTGLHIDVNSQRDAQSGFVDRPGTSIAQVSGSEVGAYINSRDLGTSVGSAYNRGNMMITPGYRFPQNAQPTPFILPNYVLDVLLDLQVPTASDAGITGSKSYVTFDIEFKDRASTQLISLNVG